MDYSKKAKNESPAKQPEKAIIKAIEASDDRLTEHCEKLQMYETRIAETDKFISQCIKKYQPFPFNNKIFKSDPSFKSTDFSENVIVPSGPYEGRLFWGQHKSGTSTFVLHGAGILYDKQSKVLQLGSFKNGKEFGQQRMIKSQPEDQRLFM